MLKITDLKVDTPATVGSSMLLVEVRPRFEYQNGQRTETITGYNYVVALPSRSFKTISVRIEGRQLMDEPEEGSYMNVEFSDLELFIYWAQGQYSVGARATGIHPVLTLDI
ncbi:MAG: hypothetical protein LUD84_01040 [Clostridiales bacterium]|nr:hypothetical protein [Clostridiales bacterium]